MPQVEIALAPEALLTLRVAQLEWDCARLQARLLQQEAEHLLAQAHQTHSQAITVCLARVHPHLPPPQGPLTLDLEGQCLRYEAAEPTLGVDNT